MRSTSNTHLRVGRRTLQSHSLAIAVPARFQQRSEYFSGQALSIELDPFPGLLPDQGASDWPTILVSQPRQGQASPGPDPRGVLALHTALRSVPVDRNNFLGGLCPAEVSLLRQAVDRLFDFRVGQVREHLPYSLPWPHAPRDEGAYFLEVHSPPHCIPDHGHCFHQGWSAP